MGPRPNGGRLAPGRRSGRAHNVLVRRQRSFNAPLKIPAPTTRPAPQASSATMVISLILIVAYVVAVWAMTGKPN
jgi:hypothetical protein